jgi:hypothetical protein
MIDLLLIVIFAGVTWAVAGEGPWGAVLVLISVILSGLLAMNLFEPTAEFLQGMLGSYEWQHRWDIVAFLGLFSLGVWGLREATDRIMPTTLEVAGLVYESRWIFGAATGYAMVAILLTALHTAPLGREFIGFKPERSNVFDAVAPDRQWMGFTQYVSENVFRSGSTGPIFDGAEFPRIPEDPNTVQVWSSFPIRYAQRRELFAGSMPGTAGPAAATSGPPTSAPPPTTPMGGGGSSGF